MMRRFVILLAVSLVVAARLLTTTAAADPNKPYYCDPASAFYEGICEKLDALLASSRTAKSPAAHQAILKTVSAIRGAHSVIVENMLTISAFLQSVEARSSNALAEERWRAEAAAAEAKRRATIDAAPWPQDMKRAVIERRVLIGMTPAQAEIALGRPGRVHEDITRDGRAVTWMYRDARVLHFRNGSLERISTTHEAR